MNTKLPPPDCYWGGPQQPYWHPGENPTADLLLFKEAPQELEILLIRRGSNVRAEPGKWAFPGGFVNTEAPIGLPWTPGQETCKSAALRELKEEASIVLRKGAQHRLVHIEIGGPGEDVRNNREAWTRKHIFSVIIKPSEMIVSASEMEDQAGPAAGDDADKAQFIPLSKALGMSLAFDHNKILLAACRQLGITLPEVAVG